MKIGLVMAYYENPLMLTHHLVEWVQYSAEVKSRLQVVIVDDASPATPASKVITQLWGRHRPIDFMVYRVEKNVPWGQDGARNIGMRHVEALWTLMTDVDHVLTRGNAARMLSFVDQNAYRGNYYMPARCRSDGSPYHAHPNTFLFHKQDFWDMGGYDEDFVGFYGSDGNFRKCAKGYGLTEGYVDTWKMVLYGRSDVDDCNTREWSRKEGRYYAPHNTRLDHKRRGPPYVAVRPFRLPYSRIM